MSVLLKTARRAVLSLTLAGLAAAALKFRGADEVPAQGGGWRELSGSDFR